jgi:hypothetical protein
VNEREEAEAFFRERGWGIRAHDAEGKWWADLISDSTSAEVLRYGSGSTETEAVIRAKRRWAVEEEPPSPPPQRLP